MYERWVLCTAACSGLVDPRCHQRRAIHVGILYVFLGKFIVVSASLQDCKTNIHILCYHLVPTKSGLLELWIDLGWVRNFDHGRYSTQKRTNLIITGLFLIGTIGDLIAFVFWRQGRDGIRKEHITQWVAAHIFLLTAILVLITNRPKYVPFQNGMDSVANVFFFSEALMSCCARYVSTVGDTKQNQTESRLELAAAVFWIASASCYVVADFIRLKDPDKIVFS